MGPGLGNFTYSLEEIGKPVSVIQHREGHSQVAMHRGYLIAIYSRDGGRGEGGISTIDISNPRNPIILHNEDNENTRHIREGHAWGFRDDVLCLQADSGIQFWDYRNPLAPKRLSYLKIPGITRSDYDVGLWWTHWQGRYVYASGTGRGIVIADAEDPQNPRFVKTIPISRTGGYRVGPVHVIGNLLITTGFDDGPSGISIFDISDPVNPILLKTFAELSSYASLVNGNKLVLGARQRPRNAAVVYDISNPSSPIRVGKQALTDSSGGGYVGFADGYAFLGRRDGVYKVDLSHPEFPVVMKGTSGHPNADDGFPTPLGNLVFAGNDHGTGSALIPHQTGRDVTGPMVNMVVPNDGTVNQARTSRIGLTFTDQIDGLSIDTSTIIIRPIGGSALKGYFASQTGIVNFHPMEPLQSNTTYEVVVPAGGIRDYAGNPNPVTFRSTFSTGNSIRDCNLSAPSPSTTGSPTLFSLTCQGLLGDSVLWDFGDNTAPVSGSITKAVPHTYPTAGIYNVVASIPSLGKSLAIQHTVLNPPTSTRPNHSSTIIYSRSGKLIWNVNSDNNSVTASSTDSLARVREVKVGKAPRTLAQGPDGTIWVANQESATLSLLGSGGEPLGTVTLPRASRPYGIAFSPTGTLAYVTLEATGELLAIDASTRAIRRRVQTVPTPRGIAVSSDGKRVLISRFLSAQAHGEIAEHDGETLALKRIFELKEDFTPDTDNSGSGVPNALSFVAISPDGRTAWIPFKKDNVRRGFLNTLMPRSLTFENTVRAGIAYIDLKENLESSEKRTDLDNRSLPNSVTFSQSGVHAFVTTGASNHTVAISTLNRRTLTAIETAELTRELAPDGSVLDARDSLLYVHYAMSREIGVFNVSEIGEANFVRKVRLFSTIGQDSLSPELLRGKQIFHNASDSRMSRDNYISCVVCHMDGGSDRRVWDFTDRNEGLRRTTSLLGKGGMAHGPLHWSANFDEVQDFEQDIRNYFGGNGFLTNEQYSQKNRSQSLGGRKSGLSPDLDALAAYVTSLASARRSPYRTAAGDLTSDGMMGRALFHDKNVGCASCHVPGIYTNSGVSKSTGYSASVTPEGFRLYNVGTLKSSSGKRMGKTLAGLDTPTLLGVWEGGPYLHDGSASTLMDVLTTQNPEDRHGRTSHLSQREKEQLVSFLLQLEGKADENLPGSRVANGAARIRHWKAGRNHVFQILAPASPTSLEILTSKGQIIVQLKAKSSEGDAALVLWDGYTTTSERLGAGIYYLRVKTQAGAVASTSLLLSP